MGRYHNYCILYSQLGDNESIGIYPDKDWIFLNKQIKNKSG